MPTRKWKTETVVNTTLGHSGDSTVTVLADGSYIVSWVLYDQFNQGLGLNWQRYNTAGIAIGSEQLLNTGIVGEKTEPEIIALADGNIWVVYRQDANGTNSNIRGVVFTPSGSFVRNQDPSILANTEGQPSIASLGSTGSVSVYTKYIYDTNGNLLSNDIYMRRFDANGNTTSLADQKVNTVLAVPYEIQWQPDVAANQNGSKYVVIWSHIEAGTVEIHGRVFNANGTEAVAEFTVNTANGLAEDYSAVTWINNSHFVATWRSPAPSSAGGVAIKYILYDAEGNNLTGEKFANTTLVGDRTFPAITGLPNGGFVIAWSETALSGPDTSYSSIRLQAFDATGQKTGGEILVNTTTTGGQNDVQLATLPDGRVVVTWTDFSTGINVYSQIIDPRDGIVDGTGLADTLYGHDAVGDIISGYDGADTIHGLNGGDVIYGGDGDDIIYAGKGDDIVYAGNDNDTIYGDAGDDDLYGEAGIDKFYTSAGSDLYNGGIGTDVLYFTGATSGAIVNMTDDTLNAGAALGDTLVGIENMFGTNHADIFVGNSGKNIFYTTGGNDILQGGLAADTLYGGTGSDSFVFAQGDSGLLSTTLDRIGDFAKGAVGVGDEIDFSSVLKIGGSATTATANEASINTTTGVATFDTGSGTTLADALNDISFRMTVAANSVGEFAFFQLGGTGDHYMFISDGVAGLGANDTLVRLSAVTTINTISIDAGDVTILT